MPKVIITHDVADVETWLHGKADRAEAVGTMGGSNVVDHVAHDRSNRIAISVDAEDVDALMAAIGSPTPELAAKMQEHGVIPPLTVYVER